jgi:hypothetical protein
MCNRRFKCMLQLVPKPPNPKPHTLRKGPKSQPRNQQPPMTAKPEQWHHPPSLLLTPSRPSTATKSPPPQPSSRPLHPSASYLSKTTLKQSFSPPFGRLSSWFASGKPNAVVPNNDSPKIVACRGYTIGDAARYPLNHVKHPSRSALYSVARVGQS